MVTSWRATDTVSVSVLGNAQVTRPLDDTSKFVHPVYAWHEYRWNASANHLVIDLHAPSVLFVCPIWFPLSGVALSTTPGIWSRKIPGKDPHDAPFHLHSGDRPTD